MSYIVNNIKLSDGRTVSEVRVGNETVYRTTCKAYFTSISGSGKSLSYSYTNDGPIDFDRSIYVTTKHIEYPVVSLGIGRIDYVVDDIKVKGDFIITKPLYFYCTATRAFAYGADDAFLSTYSMVSEMMTLPSGEYKKGNYLHYNYGLQLPTFFANEEERKGGQLTLYLYGIYDGNLGDNEEKIGNICVYDGKVYTNNGQRDETNFDITVEDVIYNYYTFPVRLNANTSTSGTIELGYDYYSHTNDDVRNYMFTNIKVN